MTTRSRRGRLPTTDRQQREQEILDHALAELLEMGIERVSMLGVARRAGASKETLYSWFGNRDGLLAALIERNADGAADKVRTALEQEADPRQTLIDFATGLVTLLTSDASIGMNRAAMSSPPLARLLLTSGRYRVGTLVETYLASLDRAGAVTVPDPADAFGLLYGLIVQDLQIRVLLGGRPPSAAEIDARSEVAVDRFLRLVTPRHQP
ncbi:MAG: TetR/AcrR family transcriptional regulator [Desertimonas sp.]